MISNNGKSVNSGIDYAFVESQDYANLGTCENHDYCGCENFNTLANQELQDYQITIEMLGILLDNLIFFWFNIVIEV